MGSADLENTGVVKDAVSCRMDPLIILLCVQEVSLRLF